MPVFARFKYQKRDGVFYGCYRLPDGGWSTEYGPHTSKLMLIALLRAERAKVMNSMTLRKARLPKSGNYYKRKRGTPANEKGREASEP